MSNLLERAIVDAKALREAALKSAENLVIEKYSDEVKTAVNRLIEQDDALGLSGSPDMDLGGAGAQDDFFGTPEEDFEDSPESDVEEPIDELDPESIIGGLPDAFNADDDEIVSIKLDSLEAELEDDDEDIRFAGDNEFEEDEIGIDILNEPDLDEEEEEEFDFDLDTDEEEISMDQDEDELGIDITNDVVQEVLDELGVDSDDIDIDELAEAVRVDFEPQKSGWAGTPETIMREYESMLIAREQDTEVKEENEELRKIVSTLQKENKTLTSAATKLQMQTEKYETAFDTLQEKMETMNVSNAKLLYINQALENASLNERQKRKIVEAISKASTVQEAKIVFDTMSDTVSTSSDVKRDSTLNEMVSRKSSLLVAARKEQKTQDANPLYNRLQKLAGITTT